MNLEFRTARAAGPVDPRPLVAEPVPDYRPPQYVPGPFRLVTDRHLEDVLSYVRERTQGWRSLSHWGLFPA